MTTYAITVFGRDRPGIVAEATGLLAGLGLNLEDSSMTLLRGRFAMTLICAGAADRDRVEAAMKPLRADRGLTVSVGAVSGSDPAVTQGRPWVLTVHGGDRPGIVSSITREVAAVEGNVTDLTTRLSGELYLLVAEIDLPAAADATALQAAVARVAEELDVVAALRPVDADEL